MDKKSAADMKEKLSELRDVSEIKMDANDWYNINIDDVWRFVGRFSKYQVIQVTLLQFVYLCLSQPVLSGMFTGKMVDYRCAVDNTSDLNLQNKSVDISSCYVQVIDNRTSHVLSTDTCTEYEYEGGETTLSYLAQWDLVCDKETLGQLPQILTMIGMLVGASTLPHLGDKFGRKKLIIFTQVFQIATTAALAFVEHFELFLFLKFLNGTFQQACVIAMFAATVEAMPLELASFIMFVSANVWVLSMCCVGFIGYILRGVGWKTLQLAMAAAMLPTLLGLCFLDESLRWLLGNLKTKEAEAILRKVCRVNNKDYNELMTTVLNNKKDEVELVSPVHKDMVCDETRQSDNVKAILSNKNMRLITLVMCYIWLVDSMTYYGLILLSTSLAGDPYANYFLTALVDVPSAWFMYYALQKFGRKSTTIVSNLIAGTALLLTVLIVQFAPPQRGFMILRTCLTLIGKFFITCSFNTVWIYVSELYPTNLRSVGIGIASSAARIGATFTPLFTILARKALWAPGVLFGAACYISVFMLVMLPETRWRQLPQNVQEIDGWFEKDRMSRSSNNEEA